MNRTLAVKLSPNEVTRVALLATMEQYTACFNAAAEFGWEGKTDNGVALHHGTYYPLRERFPQLPAELVCSSRVKATEALKFVRARIRKGMNFGQA